VSTVKIDVRGSHAITLPPERAVVHAAVGLDGPRAEDVFAGVSESVAAVRQTLEGLEGGAVESFSVDQVRTSSQRPWSQDGTQLPLVHTARASLAATFVDVAALGAWATETAQLPGVSVEYIDWQLTQARRAEVEREARQEAVRNALTIAQEYADALELGAVAVRRIRSTDAAGPQPLVRMAMESGDTAARGADLLKPQDIEVVAEVDAQFAVV
jgi:hypothetical protein